MSSTQIPTQAQTPAQTWTVTISMEERPGEIVARAVLDAAGRDVHGEGHASSFVHHSADAHSVAARRALDDLAVHMHHRLEDGSLVPVEDR